MRQAIHTCLVQLPAEQVWDFLSDFDNLMRLGLPNGTSRLIDGSRRAERSRYRLQNFFDGIRESCIAVLDEAEKPERLVWRAKVWGGTGAATFELVQLERDLTAVRLTLEHSVGSAEGPVEEIAWGVIHPNYERLMLKLPSACA